MQPINAVLAHRDPALAHALAGSLDGHFRKLAIVNDPSAIGSEIARLRASFAIIDLEMISYAELRNLCSEFPATTFTCIHRLADDLMWSEALAMGAVDCCQSNDLRGIVRASERFVPHRRAAAA